MGPLEERSSLWVAITKGFCSGLTLGTLQNPFPISTLKSKCVESPVRKYIETFEIEQCGVSPYYTTPAMRGAMKDGQWIDPWVVNLCAMKDTWSDERIWKLALADYLLGIKQLPGITELKPLTDDETWVGVPQEINSINLKTSAGAPYFMKKSNFVTVDPITREVSIDPMIQDHIDHILKIVDSGKVFVPLCAHSLKDEPVSHEKRDAYKTRVFNTLSIAFNFLVKKYFASLNKFMAIHWRFFEAFVGKDINTNDCDELIQYLCTFFLEAFNNPELLTKLKQFGDGDYQWFDLKLSSIIRQYEAKFWDEFISETAYTRQERQRAFLLVMGTIITIRFIKNDLVLIVFTNPSGSNITVWSNGVCNSLNFRFCYISEALARGLPRIPFRERVKLITLGDDNVFNVHPSIPWFSYTVITARMSQIGCTYTAADKRSENTDLKTIFECSFLKRSFEHVDGRWIAKLELKSIVKMLCYLKDSDLSVVDHTAVLVSNATRELYFHGPDIFEKWSIVLHKVADELHLKDSSLLRLYSYKELDERFKSKVYPGWLVPDRSELFKVQSD